jgi:hypothetical protein
VAGGAGGGGELRRGGCLGARCHPDCTPQGPGSAPQETPCCLDDECASSQCFKALDNRECGPSGAVAMADGECGDMSDCILGTACDLAAHRCVTMFPTTLTGAPCAVSATNALVCGIASGGGGSQVFCNLPTAPRTQGGNPCCYERSDAGARVTCLAAGTCYEEPPGSGSLGSFAGGACPL